MGGEDFDDHVAIMGDWMPPSPSPSSLFSSVISNDTLVRSFPNSVNETKTEPYQNKSLTQASISVDGPNGSNSLMEPKISSRGGGLMERRAARAGFNAPRLNTESIRHGDLPKEEVRSPYLTIPPGLSPTTLLDSPVFLTNSLVQPSPTTGKFAFAPPGCINPNSTLMMMAAEPIMTESKSVPNLHAINRAHTSFPHQTESSHHTNKNTSPSPENTSSLLDERAHDDEADGYNWRKYGQKQVKGSEYPRSYYKCTHPSCPVKKKVERSHEGHVTEIIYKGAHIHPKPTPLGRRTPNEGGGGGDLIWPVGRSNNPETPSSPSHEYVCGENQHTVARDKLGADGSLEGSFTFSNEEDNDDDRATNGSVSVGCDGEGDESELKRRRIEAYASEVSGATRAMREPRVVVQTTSEVDILDDGYRWRKYGQKVVKGNPNPRSYYKCTSPGARPLSDMAHMGFAVPKTEPKVEPVTDAGPDGSLVYQQLMSRLPLGPQM
ncbi:Probable WRKY transcription factor 2 [Striga hermonthica]|uniref:Probable WRKY transcription factor 2 n=1 Tax=Striga hermonthica TaxID=68872 RepID=A0A9N7R964_STRHE|nr:Probable WRKY transcription factor 2 [Striga hermonthica]